MKARFSKARGVNAGLQQALPDAVQLLRDLPRIRPIEDDVSAQLAAFRAAHPDVKADLIVDGEPGHPDVDFDLLLQGDTAGTIAIGWRPDRALPWSIQYSEHWASNLVLTVNGRDLTIQEALQALRFNEDAQTDLSSALVNYCLIDAAIANDPPLVSDSELQSAADQFRAARGLFDPETTARWLTGFGLSVERFEALMEARVQATKLRDSITVGDVEGYFASHTDTLAKATVVRLHAPSVEAIESLIPSTGIRAFIEATFDLPGHRDAGIKVVIETGFIQDVFPRLDADSPIPPTNMLIGPTMHDGEHCLAQILRSTPATLDQETYRRVQQSLFASWLEAERANAQIRWHWM